MRINLWTQRWPNGNHGNVISTNFARKQAETGRSDRTKNEHQSLNFSSLKADWSQNQRRWHQRRDGEEAWRSFLCDPAAAWGPRWASLTPLNSSLSPKEPFYFISHQLENNQSKSVDALSFAFQQNPNSLMDWTLGPSLRHIKQLLPWKTRRPSGRPTETAAGRGWEVKEPEEIVQITAGRAQGIRHWDREPPLFREILADSDQLGCESEETCTMKMCEGWFTQVWTKGTACQMYVKRTG